jgi:hypothetical protein
MSYKKNERTENNKKEDMKSLRERDSLKNAPAAFADGTCFYSERKIHSMLEERCANLVGREIVVVCDAV